MWFFGANWNCTISPAAAVRVEGMNVRAPVRDPTRTTWVFTEAWAEKDVSENPWRNEEEDGLTKGAAHEECGE